MKTLQISKIFYYDTNFFFTPSSTDEPISALSTKGCNITWSLQTEVLTSDGLGFQSELCHLWAYER